MPGKTELTVTPVTLAGAFLAEVAADVSNGNMFANAGGVFVLARNADGAATHTVTLVTPGKIDGLDIADPAVVVPISGTLLIGPFPTNLFNNLSGADAGKVYISADSAQIKLTVYRLP